MSGTPPRTQSLQSLQKANRVRMERTRVKQQIRALPPTEGFGVVADVLDTVPDEWRTATAMELLLAVKLVGRYYALSWLRRAGVPEHRQLGELTVRQRSVLAGLLRANEGRRAA